MPDDVAEEKSLLLKTLGATVEKVSIVMQSREINAMYIIYVHTMYIIYIYVIESLMHITNDTIMSY